MYEIIHIGYHLSLLKIYILIGNTTTQVGKYVHPTVRWNSRGDKSWTVGTACQALYERLD